MSPYNEHWDEKKVPLWIEQSVWFEILKKITEYDKLKRTIAETLSP